MSVRPINQERIKMNSTDRLSLSLLLLRIGIFIVMLMWTLDKFLHPEHSTSVYEHFYFLPGLAPSVFYLIGAAELALITGFVIGLKKRFTYGAILLLHGISTLSSYRQYLTPFQSGHLLFFAAWPMLAACFALYYLRDADTRWVVR
jgi:putative oxidoreductase